MNGIGRAFTIGGAGAMLVALTAASQPLVLTRVSGGLWEVSGLHGAPTPQRICVPDPAAFAQIEHRTTPCSRTVIRESGSTAEVHYTCPGGRFGQTNLSLITPRSLRIETQGISTDGPFHHVVQARRIGDCGTKMSAH
jgi:hypothetical protein